MRTSEMPILILNMALAGVSDILIICLPVYKENSPKVKGKKEAARLTESVLINEEIMYNLQV